jgi:ATP-dependent DNA helicase RecG
MHKLGLKRDIDLALHLPMRYEDQTRLVPIGTLRDGEMAQVQGVVRDCRIEARGRRQLVVRLADDSGELVLRLSELLPLAAKGAGGGPLRARARRGARRLFSAARWCTPSSASCSPTRRCRRR